MTTTSSTFTAYRRWLLSSGLPDTAKVMTLLPVFPIHSYLSLSCVSSISVFVCIYLFFSFPSGCFLLQPLSFVSCLLPLQPLMESNSLWLDLRIDGDSRWTDSRWQMDCSCWTLTVQCSIADRLAADTVQPTRLRERVYIKTPDQTFDWAEDRSNCIQNKCLCQRWCLHAW